MLAEIYILRLEALGRQLVAASATSLPMPRWRWFSRRSVGAAPSARPDGTAPCVDA